MGFQRDVVTTFGSRAAALVLGVVRSVIVARALMPEGRGQYATLMLVPQLMVMVVPLGMQWALTYHLRRGDRSRDTVVRNGMTLVVLLGLTGFAATAIVHNVLDTSFLAGLTGLAILLAAVSVPVQVIQNSLLGVLRGTERIGKANALFSLRGVALISGVLVALVLMRGGVTGLVAGILVGDLVVLALGTTWALRGIAPKPALDPPFAREMLSYGLRLHLFSILMFVNYRVGLAVVRAAMDYTETGYYVTAVTLAEYLWMVPNALSFVLFPSVIGVSAERRDRLTSVVSRVTTGLMLLACGGFAAVGYPLILLLYGRPFLPAVAPLIAILPGIWVMSIQQVIGSDLSGRGRPGLVTVSAAAGVGVNLALSLWWVRLWGPVGAALASSVAYAVVAGLVLVFYRSVSGVPLRDVLVPRIADWNDLVARVRARLGRSRS